MNYKILKNKNFSFLMLGQLISLIGTGIQNFSLSLYVLQITGSTTQFASTLAVSLIPKIILAPINGVLVDWLNKKKIIIYSDFFCGFLIMIYFFIFKLNGTITIKQIYILSILLSAISTLFEPAISSIIPIIVEKNKLVDANGINSTMKIIPQILSPIIASILFSLSGLYYIFLLNGLSFIFSAFLEVFINTKELCKNDKNKIQENIVYNFKKDFIEGINFIKNKKILLSLSFLGLIANFAYSPIYTIGFLYISKKILKISNFQYGILNVSFVIAMILSSVFSGKILKKINLGKLYVINIYTISYILFLISIIPSKYFLSLFETNFFPYIMLIFTGFILSFISTVGNIGLTSIIQKEVPLNFLGRFYSIFGTICTIAIPIGQMVFGLLFDKINASICIIFSGLILFITISILGKKINGEESMNINQIS